MTKRFFQAVKNLDKFGPVTNDTVVIIIQVNSNCFLSYPSFWCTKKGKCLLLLLNILVVVVLWSSGAKETGLSFLMLSHVSYLAQVHNREGNLCCCSWLLLLLLNIFVLLLLLLSYHYHLILSQVHNREGYLRQLVNSLSAARHIENTLLVFSHDVWDEQINTLVRYESS